MKLDSKITPTVKEGMTIVEHNDIGEVEFTAQHIIFHLTEPQMREENPKGEIVLSELKREGVPMLNATFLDEMFKHDLFLKDWTEGYWEIPFWGTIYADKNGQRHVRVLENTGGVWAENYIPLFVEFGTEFIAPLYDRSM